MVLSSQKKSISASSVCLAITAQMTQLFLIDIWLAKLLEREAKTGTPQGVKCLLTCPLLSEVSKPVALGHGLRLEPGNALFMSKGSSGRRNNWFSNYVDNQLTSTSRLLIPVWSAHWPQRCGTSVLVGNGDVSLCSSISRHFDWNSGPQIVLLFRGLNLERCDCDKFWQWFTFWNITKWWKRSADFEAPLLLFFSVSTVHQLELHCLSLCLKCISQ